MVIRTIIHKQYWKIIKLFYENKNKPIHLRGISRKINLKESSTSLHLKSLSKLLKIEKEANLKKYSLKPSVIPLIFPLYDSEKLENLPLLRKNAIKEYIKALPKKPILIIVFGSTAKGTYNQDSDIDILQISNMRIKKAKEHAESITGMNLQIFQISDIKSYKDDLVKSALSTGFPVFNKDYFYEIYKKTS